MRHFKKFYLSLFALAVVTLVLISPAKANASESCGSYTDLNWFGQDYALKACVEESNFWIHASAYWEGSPEGADIYMYIRDDSIGTTVFSKHIFLPSSKGLGVVVGPSAPATSGHKYHVYIRSFSNAGLYYEANSPELTGYIRGLVGPKVPPLPRTTYNTKTNHNWSNKHNAFLRN